MTSQSNSILVAGPGELDPQFAAQGVLDIPSGEGSIRAIVADGQGAYLVAVWVSSQCWLYRIFSDGGLDTQYGQNGVSKWSFVPGVDSLPTELIMQPDGKVILLGKVGDDPFKRQTAITRFNVGGSPDLVFRTRVLPDIDMSLPAGCLQADGKILVLVNRLNSSTTEHELVLYRFMSTGDPDGAFGGQGFVNILFNDERSDGKSVAVTDDAKILVGGTVTRDTKTTKAVGRFHSTGALDSSFGRAGYWESASGLAMGKMIVDGDTIICVGNAQVNGSSVAAVSRVTAEGVTDPAFNNGTAATIDIRADFPGLYVICRSVVVQSDKGIVFAGEAGGSIKAYVGRLSAGGAIDSGFGDQGLSSGLRKVWCTTCAFNRVGRDSLSPVTWEIHPDFRKYWGSDFNLAPSRAVSVEIRRRRVSTDVPGCYLANNCPISLNALNSSALPHGSNRNIVACSPTSP